MKKITFNNRDWYVYSFKEGSLEGWKSYGIKHERISDNRDITVLTIALSVLALAEPTEEWFNEFHEYWITFLPKTFPLVCVRPKSNPFEGGWIVSSVELPYLES